jgi:hypothetical protein
MFVKCRSVSKPGALETDELSTNFARMLATHLLCVQMDQVSPVGGDSIGGLVAQWSVRPLRGWGGL